MRGWMAILAAASLVFAWVGSAEATLILSGSATFTEPDGGVGTPGFSGLLSFELFDSGGGTSSLAGGAAPSNGTDFSLVLQIAMDANTDTATELTLVSMSAFQLGTGDGTFFVSPGPTGGGPIGASQPTFSIGLFGHSADYDFTGLAGGGLAEGATSAPVYFWIPDVDLTATGSTQIPEGDQFTVSFTTSAANSVDIQVNLVPEPGTGLLLGMLGMGLHGVRRRL